MFSYSFNFELKLMCIDDLKYYFGLYTIRWRTVTNGYNDSDSH